MDSIPEYIRPLNGLFISCISPSAADSLYAIISLYRCRMSLHNSVEKTKRASPVKSQNTSITRVVLQLNEFGERVLKP